MIADRFVEATVLFILAGLSDAADGFIAKRFNAVSELGAYLDPVADKALLVSVFVTLGFKGLLPAWLIVLVVSRDLFIIGGMLLAYVLSNPMAVQAALGVEGEYRWRKFVLIAFVLGDRSGVTRLRAVALCHRCWRSPALTVASAGAYLDRVGAAHGRRAGRRQRERSA